MVTPGRLARFTTQGLGNSLWAYATLRFYPALFLQVSHAEVRSSRWCSNIGVNLF